ncbi:Flp pilus assembly complex ATPase component TadA [Candidatus Pacearchaeota archaeon]|nr:Flp pilus assembly complex ATPase component TadA [Candidatus Pacearchaeota archaeon]
MKKGVVEEVEKIEINLSPVVPSLPRFKDKTQIDVRYMLISPYVSAHIYWNKELSEVAYEIEEPMLTELEKQQLEKLEKGMRELINVNLLVEKNVDAILEYINKTAKLLASELGLKMTKDTYKKLFYYIFRDFVGLNEIEPFLRDYFIEDIECNGVDTPIYIIHRVYRNLRTNIAFHNIDNLASFVEKLAQRCGRYISYATPLLDGTLPDGSRVNATYTADITSRGPTFCFKDGYVQLSDGRIKNIKELFEESKKNFGFRIENGNEIVKVANINCCGVGERDLQQKDSRIESIIKLKAPKKLVKIHFEDGGEIEVTLNHLFHVAGNSLDLIEARNLKKDMLIPMPRKLEVSGYRQKIDVYSIIKDFSYLKKICIINTPAVKNIVTSEMKSGGRNFRQVLSQKYGVEDSYFYGIVHKGNSISFTILDGICKQQNLNFNDLEEISVNVYGGGTKNKTKSVKVPREIDEELAYLTGALISDGHLSKEYIDFSCYEDGFKKSVKEKLLNKFGRFDSYCNDNRIYVCNLFVPFFFNKLFGIPIGKKSPIVKIPELIFKSDNRVIASFIRGLFDGDATCRAGLSYKTYSKSLAEGLTYLLARLGIYSYLRKTEKEYRVNIPSPYYKRYRDMIGFDSISKTSDLKRLVEKQVEHKTFIRHDRIPGAPVMAIINRLGIKKKELLKNCCFSYNRFLYMSFSKDFVQKLFEEITKDENVGLVKKELEYIDWLLNSKQEFVKISNIEIIDNKEQVYDIELEPCKFFIAGNKPMNIFDTIRKFTKIPWTPIQLISLNTLSPEMLAYFWILIQYKCNILITGGTASGKTTLLNALAFFIPPEARVVSIEDTRELNLPRENWLPNVARTGIGVGGIGEVDLFSLLKNSFRQNPNYVIVGEVRGKEAFVLFQGMASGHPSISTIHADSVDTVIKRLETPPIELSPTLVNTLDVVGVMTHAIVNKQETRRLREVIEVVNVTPEGIAITNTPFIWNAADDRFYFKKDSRVLEKIMNRYGLSKEELLREFDIRTRILFKMFQNKIFGFDEVQRMINEYYKNPKDVLTKLGLV